ncbi:MAG: hypothetical protein IAG10_22325 [Planctomycetaceae bacterium]|nr:hypothetical protein [Planctomycetaceae bacterium]
MLLWVFLACIFPTRDTDLWWHLRTGDYILEHHRVPFVDLFTFTDADKVWVDLHWGFQIVLATVYRLGGLSLVILVKAGIIAASAAIAYAASGKPLPSWVRVVFWMAPAIAITGRAFERPEVISQVFLAAWLWIVPRLPERPKLAWWLPVIQLVWVNCHSLFALGPVVAVAFVIDYVVRRRLASNPTTRRVEQSISTASTLTSTRFGLRPIDRQPSIKLILQVAGLIVLAAFMNSYFDEGAFFPLVVFRKFTTEHEFYSQSIGEFASPIDFLLEHGLSNVLLVSEIVTWVVAAVSFLSLGLRGQWSPFRLVLFAAFSYLEWKATRNSTIFALVAGFVACANFGEAYVLSNQDRGKLDQAVVDNKTSRWSLSVIGVWLVGCVLVITGVWHQVCGESRSFGVGETPNWFIHTAAKFAGQPGFPQHAFVANNGQAAVYDYHNGPERRVFMDGRLEVCTEQTFRSYLLALQLMSDRDRRWEQIVRQGAPDMPVVILDSRFSRNAINGLHGTPGWRMVFADGTAAVFLEERLAIKLQLPAVPPPIELLDPDGKLRAKGLLK